ncbi:MAG: DHHA1 domain-containing protein [Sandaracinaceae bacterium]
MASPTLRAYFDDVLADRLESTVLAHGKLGDRTTVVLDRTVFYPESGGQMADRGTLDGRAVLDVQVDDDGVVHHVLDATPEDLPAIGARVAGRIDRARRREHMALHTAQHMLSRALVDLAKAETVSSRLGESACTIDVDRDGLGEARVAEAEAVVNRLIDEDRAVRAWFPSDEELRALPLRRAPKQTANVRVVEVEGFDVSPCGGTHVVRTAEVQLVRITGLERYKGGTRVTFTAGPRARGALFEEDRALRALAKELLCPPLEVGKQLARLRAELGAAREEAGRYRAIVARVTAEEARTRAEDHRVVVMLDDGDVELARSVASHLTKEGALVAIVGARLDEGVHVVVARGPASTEDCSALLKALVTRVGGRGGGRPERAEGRLPPGASLAVG